MIKIITLATQFIVAILVASLFTSCQKSTRSSGMGLFGSGEIVSRTRTVNEDFTSIEVSHGIKLIVEQADSKSITIKSYKNMEDSTTTNIENGVLKIESEKSYNSNGGFASVIVKMPVINGLISNDGSEITSQNTLISKNIKVKSSGGSKINIAVEADFIQLESKSGSNIEVNGKALKLETYSANGSEINTENLIVNEVISESESGSSTSVFPIIKLDAKASSGSSIIYYKKPKSLSKEENSGGTIREN